MANQKEKELERKLKEIQKKELEEKSSEAAEKAGLPYIDLNILPVQREALDLVDEKEAEAANLVPVYRLGKTVRVAVIDPESEETKKILEKLKKEGYSVKLYVASQSGINRALGFYKDKTKARPKKPGIVELEEKVGAMEKEIKNLSDIKEKISKIATTEVLEILFAGALAVRASDIHFEPGEKGVRLRFRIDGVLEDVLELEKKDYPPVISRIKLMAGLKLNIHDRPQDGRFTVRQPSADIEVRISTLPGESGESIVMRMLDPRTIKKDLEELGLREDLLEKIRKLLKKTTGAILTTGPTGSGKTTTLYAFLNFVNKPGVKIVTIEDPIEYHIQGLYQTQVEPEKGYSFANGLRSIVRQDPDIILVGEIRDAETAEIAMHAALTGHLVFTTLHTNDAAGTIPRLLDMGVKPQIIAPAINAAMAQRLVRKLCDQCKEKSEATSEEIKKMKEVLKNLPPEVKVSRLNEKTELYRPGACSQCNLTGYKERVGIFEAFLIDEEMEKMILKNPSISEIREAVIKKGMVTMRQDGYIKVLEGVTDLAEVERVLGE